MVADMVNNRDSLRTQIIDAIRKSEFWDMYRTENVDPDTMFDEAIMPVLDAAMKAGELLMHRATTPQLPVRDAIYVWLEGTCASMERMQAEADTLSRREMLQLLSHIASSANIALADAKNLQMETGNPLVGITLPTKG